MDWRGKPYADSRQESHATLRDLVHRNIWRSDGGLATAAYACLFNFDWNVARLCHRLYRLSRLAAHSARGQAAIPDAVGTGIANSRRRLLRVAQVKPADRYVGTAGDLLYIRLAAFVVKDAEESLRRPVGTMTGLGAPQL